MFEWLMGGFRRGERHRHTLTRALSHTRGRLRSEDVHCTHVRSMRVSAADLP